MNHVHFLIPVDFEARTGCYLYDRQIMAGLTALGWRVDLHRLDASFPLPTPAALAEALARVMTEPGLRERLMAGARVARRALPDWPTTSARFAAALRFVTA